jgi:hypothetical protein
MTFFPFKREKPVNKEPAKAEKGAANSSAPPPAAGGGAV